MNKIEKVIVSLWLGLILTTIIESIGKLLAWYTDSSIIVELQWTGLCSFIGLIIVSTVLFYKNSYENET